jgi:hypothetical protein
VPGGLVGLAALERLQMGDGAADLVAPVWGGVGGGASSGKGLGERLLAQAMPTLAQDVGRVGTGRAGIGVTQNVML